VLPFHPRKYLNVLMPEVVLQGACVLAVIGEFETAGMAKHVRVLAEGHLRLARGQTRPTKAPADAAARSSKPLQPQRAQPVGRPLAASEAQQATVRKLRKAGKSLRWIAEETALGLNTVRTILVKANGHAEAS
jgi:hypothetical protein